MLYIHYVMSLFLQIKNRIAVQPISMDSVSKFQHLGTFYSMQFVHIKNAPQPVTCGCVIHVITSLDTWGAPGAPSILFSIVSRSGCCPLQDGAAL